MRRKNRGQQRDLLLPVFFTCFKGYGKLSFDYGHLCNLNVWNQTGLFLLQLGNRDAFH